MGGGRGRGRESEGVGKKRERNTHSIRKLISTKLATVLPWKHCSFSYHVLCLKMLTFIYYILEIPWVCLMKDINRQSEWEEESEIKVFISLELPCICVYVPILFWLCLYSKALSFCQASHYTFFWAPVTTTLAFLKAFASLSSWESGWCVQSVLLCSSVLAWRIPGTAEPGGLLSMGLHRIGHDWSNLAAVAVAVALLKFLVILSWNLWFISEVWWDNRTSSRAPES